MALGIAVRPALVWEEKRDRAGEQGRNLERTRRRCRHELRIRYRFGDRATVLEDGEGEGGGGGTGIGM